MFKCECGKEFTNPQSFNGHKSHCKVHYIAKYGGTLEWEQNVELNATRIKKAGKERQQKLMETKTTKDNKWLAEKHLCERCGKVMTEKFGSGRFCSRACANARDHSEETKQKISGALTGQMWMYDGDKNANMLNSTKICKVCGKAIRQTNKTGFCRECLYNTHEGLVARQELGRAVHEAQVENGTYAGWLTRKSVPSTAERFWMEVLTNNGIAYEREVPVHCGSKVYSLDFLIRRNGKLIDLEIDGPQHKQEDRAMSDRARDAYTQTLGYITYRISWNKQNTPKGKMFMQQKINDFLEFYNSL
jgi:very-short-patch-repair endonuclease